MNSDGKAELLSRTSTGVAIYRWSGSAWSADAEVTDELFGADCSAVQCYSAFQPFDPSEFTSAYLLTRPGGDAPANQQGAQLLAPPDWDDPLETPDSPQDPTAGPFNSQSGWPDCVPGAKNTECFDVSPSYYETLRAADIDGVPGDELLGRLDDGLRAKRYGKRSTDITDDLELAFDNDDNWHTRSGVPGAFNGTESVGISEGATATWQGEGEAHSQLVQVIGPKGPDFDDADLRLQITPGGGAPNIDDNVNQFARTLVEQQVLYSFVVPAGASPQIKFTSFSEDVNEQGAAIDAVKTSTFDDTGWASLATLDVLSGFGSALAKQNLNGFWASIRTGDIDGDGKDEVLRPRREGLAGVVL